MQPRRLLLTLAIAALLAGVPCASYAGGRSVMNRGGALSSPSTILVSPHFVAPHHGMRSPFRGPRGFGRRPFFAWGPGVVWVDPDEVAVAPKFAEAVPNEAPVPGPKFLFPPTASAPSPAGSHTVIVQRGSQIEVQSFPAVR